MTLAASCEGTGLNPMSFSEQHGSTVLERLRYQRETGRFCDVAILVKGRQFSAHRNILASCSPYFDSILQATKVVKEKVVVNCQSPGAFELLLNYIYSGCVVVDRSNVSDLLHLANNFLVTKLKNYCAEYLNRYLDAANCLSVKALAKRYNLPSLLKDANEYFDVNINRCLLESVDIVRYPMTQLMKIINDPKYQDVISPDVHLKLIVRWVGEDLSTREGCFRQLLDAVPLVQVSENTLEFVLDYSPLLTKSQTSRFLLLRSMQENGLSLEKYQPQLSSLAQQVGNDGIMESVPYYDEDDDEDGEGVEDEEMEDSPVEGQPTSRQILDMTDYDDTSSERPRIRLKISIGGGGNVSKRKVDKNKLHKKAINNLIAKRRASRPKEMPESDVLPMLDDDDIDGVYATSSLEGAITYTDEDFIDPDVVEEGEDNPVEGGTYHCGFCRFASTLDEDVEKHRARVHNRNTTFMCQWCSFECIWSKEFYAHCKEHFPQGSYQCDQCPTAGFQRIQDLLSHRLLHSEDRFFKCACCGFRGRTRTQLWAHERMHNSLDERPFHCEECGRGFSMDDMLQRHQNTHDEPRNFICEDCGFMTNNSDHLSMHRRQHLGDIFYCHFDNCDYSSPKKSQLAAHLRTHMAVRAHMCKICGRGFIEKSHLVRHERIHLEDKPFKCDICDYASSRRDKLKEHILKHHNGNTNGVKSHRRRYKRARQLAVLNAQAKTAPPEAMFRPIPSNEVVSQWADNQAAYQQTFPSPRHLQQPGPSDPSTSYNRAFSVTHPPPQHGGLSPSSMSLINLPLGMGNDDLLDKNTMGDPMGTPQLITPAPRSPQSFMNAGPSDMMQMHSGDPYRPMSLPNYGQQQQQHQGNDQQHQMQHSFW